MKIGDRIYYTGDRANGSSAGTITACNPANKYVSESVNILFDEKRFEGDTRESRMVLIQNFAPGPGRRFYMLDEWEAERQVALKALQAKYANPSIEGKGERDETLCSPYLQTKRENQGV